MGPGTQALQSGLIPELLAKRATSVLNILVPTVYIIGALSQVLFLYLCTHDYLALARKFTKRMLAGESWRMCRNTELEMGSWGWMAL